MIEQILKNLYPKIQASPIKLSLNITNPFGGEDIKCQITVETEKKLDEKNENGDEAKTEEKKI